MQSCPSIPLVILHDMRCHLGPYVRDVKTPHIYSAGRRGCHLRAGLHTPPQCSPHRVSLQTKLRPHSNGLIG